MNALSILVADDDKTTSGYLSQLLTKCGYSVETVASGEDVISRLNSPNPPNLLLLDVLMPGMDGIETLDRVKKINPSIPIIILSAIGQTKTVVEAMKMGAGDYLTKPFEDEELQLAIQSAFEKQELLAEVKTLRQKVADLPKHWDAISSNPKMVKIKEIAKQVADVDVPVLILGESGVGKEVVARYIHAQSTRSDRPLIKVNCAALPDDLLESELFGYERGAFTGALAEKPGKFELAHKGSILLDEIGEISMHLQAKLLHVLQDGEYMRLGGKHTIRADARILAATNRPLKEAVSQGEFREDLYFRLNVIKLEIPPLRERREDIPLLCDYFVQKYREKYRSPVEQLPLQIMEAFLEYDWPGNIRQLENAVKRYLILPETEVALTELRLPAHSEAGGGRHDLSLKNVVAHAVERTEREVVLRALEETNWNRKKAASNLGICYKALLNKLKKWQVKDGGWRTAAPKKEDRGSPTPGATWS